MKIFYLGRYNSSEILSGPEKYSINLFKVVLENTEATFIQYYFKDCDKSNLVTRLLGREKEEEIQNVLRIGSIRLFLLLLKTQPEIIHILTADRFTIPIYLYKIILRSKVITTFHSILRYEIPNNQYKKRKTGKLKDYIWEWLAIKFSDRLVFLSQQHINLAKEFYNLEEKKIVMIPNGVEMEFYNPNKLIDASKYINIVFYNGIRDSINRGLDFIIASLNRLNYSNIRLYIIGRKDEISDTKFYIECVRPMKREMLIEFLKDKHILLKSVAYDSFSIFALECMVAGLIPIISDNIGLSSFIVHGQNGFIYSNKDMNGLTKLVRDILNGKYKLQEISENAKGIIDKLNWGKIRRRYLDLYDSLNEN